MRRLLRLLAVLLAVAVPAHAQNLSTKANQNLEKLQFDGSGDLKINLIGAGGTCGALGGDLSGTCSSATVSKIAGSTTLPASFFPALTGDVTTTQGSLGTTLKNTGPGITSCGDTTHSCSATIDVQGRVTALSNNVISAGNVSSGTLTTGVLPKASGAAAIADSILKDVSTAVDTGLNAGYASEIPNNTITGTTVNRLVKASAGKAIIAATTDNDSILGICTSGCGTAGNPSIVAQGPTLCDFDGGVTQDDLVTRSTTTGGKCHDLGTAPSSGNPSLGTVLAATNGATGTYLIWFNGPNSSNVTNVKGGGGKAGVPAGSTGAVQYNGGTGQFAGAGPTSGAVPYWNSSTSMAASAALTANRLVKGGGAGGAPADSSITDDGSTVSSSEAASFGGLTNTGARFMSAVVTPSTTGSVASTTGYEKVTAGAGGVTRTLPVATGLGRIIDFRKEDSAAGSVTIARAGSDTINGATNVVLANQYEFVTLQDSASGTWDVPLAVAGTATNAYAYVCGNTSGLALAATEIVGSWKPTRGLTLTQFSGIVQVAGTCAACGVTDHTFRVTDGTTNSDATNGSAITCTTAAGTAFVGTPTNTSRASGQVLKLETVATGGTCTTEPQIYVCAEFAVN